MNECQSFQGFFLADVDRKVKIYSIEDFIIGNTSSNHVVFFGLFTESA